ncbi:MAG: phosphoglycolate phosphatase [Burkholderiales bacterium]|jgi:phosphoglycolate phosphatase|nr:phosphoglycolate phosphatase [Burkholderiales bacterium]MCE1177324.1 phosphoglycolate phosphatase [Burkholderiales bacterium]
MNHPSIKAVLFDLDGTLTHSAPDLSTGINRMRAEYNLPSIDINGVVAMIGHGVRSLVANAMRDVTSQNPDFDLELAYQRFAKHYHEVNGTDSVEFDGVTETLKNLHAKGIKLGVVTNKASEFALPLIHSFVWSRWLDVIVCGDTLSIKKPKPEPLLHACTQLNVTVDEVLYVGDSMTDVLTAQAAQCRCVVLSYGYNEGVPIREALAQQALNIPIFDHFAQAVQL